MSEIDWEWFFRYFKWLIIILFFIYVFGEIEKWVNKTDKSVFVSTLTPFTNSLLIDGLILTAILFVAVWLKYREQ